MKLKDKKIEILKATFTKDKIGQGIENLEPIAPPVWAYFRQLSQKEIFACSATHVAEEVLFVVNYRADISTRNVVRFRGRLYDVTRVDLFEGYRGEVGVFARGR
jgi:SPP1 family predicted phage head-tail adaptor